MSSRRESLLSHPLVLSFYLPSLLIGVAAGFLVPVMPLFAKELNNSYALVGLVLSGEAIGMLIGDVPAGILARHLGLKRAMVVGGFVMALSTVALASVHSVAAAIPLRIVTGMSHSLYSVSQHAYVAGMASLGRRGRSIALFGGVTRIGQFMGPLIGGIAGGVLGLRAAFPLFGAFAGMAVLAVALFVRGSAGDAEAMAERRSSGLREALLSRWRVLAAAGAGQMFAQTIRAGRGAIIPLYAADVLGLDVQSIGLVISLAAAVDMTLFYPAGWLMDHLGRKFAIVPSFTLQAIGMSLVPLTTGFAGLVGAAMLIGFGNGLGSGTMMTLGADLAPPETRREFLGIWRLIGDGGHMAGPVVVGQVADTLALPQAAYAMAAAGLCAGLVFGLLLPEPTKMHERVQAGGAV